MTNNLNQVVILTRAVISPLTLTKSFCALNYPSFKLTILFCISDLQWFWETLTDDDVLQIETSHQKTLVVLGAIKYMVVICRAFDMISISNS